MQPSKDAGKFDKVMEEYLTSRSLWSHVFDCASAFDNMQMQMQYCINVPVYMLYDHVIFIPPPMQKCQTSFS